MRKLIITSLIALPALAAAETKLIEMPPDQVRPTYAPAKEEEAKPEPKKEVATVEEAIASTDPAAPAVVEKAPEPEKTDKPKHKDKWIEPFVAIAGGMRLESLGCSSTPEQLAGVDDVPCPRSCDRRSRCH